VTNERNGIRFRGAGIASDYLDKKVTKTAWCSINSCVRTVYTDSFLSESEEGSLLSVSECEGLQAAEYGGIWELVRLGNQGLAQEQKLTICNYY